MRRGERTVLRDINVSVKSGEVLRLVGHNGSGKTTLIRTIAGLLPADEGRIALDGADEDASICELCHLIGHHNALKSSLSVRENLTFWQRYLGGTRTFVDEALDYFHLEALADIPTGLLSAGQKRRTGLARLMVAKRPIWLLDEPTTSLDTASCTLVTDAIDAHTRAGGLAIVATHLTMAMAGARDLALKAGEVVAS